MARKETTVSPNRSNSRNTAHRPSATPHVTMPQPAEDLMAYVKDYARERPEVVALWCFGIGFVLGWKIKPW